MNQSLIDLIALGIIVLFGTQGDHWDYYETDPQWWQLRLQTRIN